MDSPFPDVDRPTSVTTCLRCRLLFQAGDSLVQAWLVAGVGKHPYKGRQVPFLNEVPAFIHARCQDRKLAEVGKTVEIPRHQLKPSSTPPLRPRTPEYQCHLCKKQLQRGDAVIVSVRVLGIGIDPETKQPAAECSQEYETIHVDCKDPRLDLGGPLVVTS